MPRTAKPEDHLSIEELKTRYRKMPRTSSERSHYHRSRVLGLVLSRYDR